MADPRLTKKQWPEFIALQLGIPTVQGTGGPWHSYGDTTDREWFVQVSEALGVPYRKNRVRTMQALVESVGARWRSNAMSSELTRSRGGGNLKVAAFEALWAGIETSRTGQNALQASETRRELAMPRKSLGKQGRSLHKGWSASDKVNRFCASLLEAYGFRCAITRCDIQESLEAAHITPHASGGPSTTQNGLLLRADLHSLFDLHLISVDPSTWTVLVNPKILKTDFGSKLFGASFSTPHETDHRPSQARLIEHRLECKL